MARIDVITGVERRRRWSVEQKRAVVAAAFAPGAVVADVARRADVCSSLIYRWRREFAGAPAGFAEVIVSPVDSDDDTGGGDGPGRGSAVAARPDFGDAAAAIEVAVGGAAHVRIPATIPPALAAAVIAALVGR